MAAAPNIMTLFTTMYGYVETAIAGAVATFGSGLVSFVAAPLALAAAIYFLLLGFAVLRGAIQAPLRELVFQAGSRYLGSVQSSNRNAPSNIYGDKGYVSIAIRTISFLSPTVAQVRYSKIITFGQNTPVAQNWNAIMTFKYTTAPEHEKDRTLNPLGFQVVNYRSDPEA